MTTRKSVKSTVTTATEAKGFDLSAALAAAAEAPKSSRTRTSSGENDRLNVITQILEAAPSGLSMPQIKAAYFAGKGIVPTKKEEKQVYETVFQHSDACGNKNHKEGNEVFTRNESGAYSLKK